jgi:integrase
MTSGVSKTRLGEAEDEPLRKEKKTRLARRYSYQTGSCEPKRWKNGDKGYTIRYWVRDSGTKTGWRYKRENLRSVSQKQAKKILSERLSEVNALNNNPSQQAPSMTFAEFASGLWKNYLGNKLIKPSTAYSYDSMIEKHLMPAFGAMQLGQITTLDVTEFFNKAREKLASKYRLNLYALLNTMFDVAVQHDLIGTSPVRRKLHRPQHEPKEKPVLSGEQVRKVIEAVANEYKPLFVVTAVTGMRIGEVLALRWEDVDLDARKMTVRHNLWRGQLGTPKTKASAKTRNLSDLLITAFRIQKLKSRFTQPDDFIFTRRDGRPYDRDWLRERVLYPALNAAAIERKPRQHGFHLFRHTCGSIVYALTGDIRLAKDALAHSRISTTSDIYVHTSEVPAEVAELVGREINYTLIAPQESELFQ